MRRVLLLLSIQFVALAALAQVSAEYGHASSEPLETIIKTPRHTSATLLLLNGRGYEGTLGGQLVPDRLWFFGSASVLPRTNFTRFTQPSPATPPATTPQSFLSLRSTAVLSDQTTLKFSVTRHDLHP